MAKDIPPISHYRNSHRRLEERKYIKFQSGRFFPIRKAFNRIIFGSQPDAGRRFIRKMFHIFFFAYSADVIYLAADDGRRACRWAGRARAAAACYYQAFYLGVP